MPRIAWDKAGERFFETGVDRGVYYPRVGSGVPWNGLVSVSESAAGGEVEGLYYDGVKYLDVAAGEDFEATLEAYSTPLAFAASEGVKYISPGLSVGQQPRKTFGLSYRTLIGNDLVGASYGYKLHLVYNITASPSARNSRTMEGTATAETRSWKLDAVPPPATTFRPTAHIVVDSTIVNPLLMKELETVLYGRDAAGNLASRSARLPTVSEIVTMLSNTITSTIEATI